LERWVGDRPPEGYVCKIPCNLKTFILRKAARHVLRRISVTDFGDALRLERMVHLVAPLEGKRNGRTMGRWRPPTVLIKDDKMRFEAACALIAHEFGHAASEAEVAEGGLSRLFTSEVPRDWFTDRGADRYAIKWGFGRELRKLYEEIGRAPDVPDTPEMEIAAALMVFGSFWEAGLIDR